MFLQFVYFVQAHSETASVESAGAQTHHLRSAPHLRKLRGKRNDVTQHGRVHWAVSVVAFEHRSTAVRRAVGEEGHHSCTTDDRRSGRDIRRILSALVR
jgi:hypothetical protein